jgi:hypothetical protein
MASPRNLFGLYTEAVEVSNAASAFEDLREFDETTLFVENITKAQVKLVDHILEVAEKAVIEAAASGAKSSVVYTFRGGDMFDGFSILFMMLGGVEYEQKVRLDNYGFEPALDKLTGAVQPFSLRHNWDRATNTNSIILIWE